MLYFILLFLATICMHIIAFISFLFILFILIKYFNDMDIVGKVYLSVVCIFILAFNFLCFAYEVNAFQTAFGG